MFKSAKSVRVFNTVVRAGMMVLFVGVLMMNSGKSTSIQCDRGEQNYVTCQQQKSSAFGVRRETDRSFRLRDAHIETHHHRDSDGNPYETYTLYLATPEVIEFYDYRSKYRQANGDLARFKSLLQGSEPTSFALKRQNIFEDIFSLIIISLVFLPWLVFSPAAFMVLFTMFNSCLQWLQQKIS